MIKGVVHGMNHILGLSEMTAYLCGLNPISKVPIL